MIRRGKRTVALVHHFHAPGRDVVPKLAFFHQSRGFFRREERNQRSRSRNSLPPGQVRVVVPRRFFSRTVAVLQLPKQIDPLFVFPQIASTSRSSVYDFFLQHEECAVPRLRNANGGHAKTLRQPHAHPRHGPAHAPRVAHVFQRHGLAVVERRPRTVDVYPVPVGVGVVAHFVGGRAHPVVAAERVRTPRVNWMVLERRVHLFLRPGKFTGARALVLVGSYRRCCGSPSGGRREQPRSYVKVTRGRAAP
mmetsp:Transcript_8349/g.20093  ORF Transcript_8349/g.20093 Transcript_8349/m.20093 type:complete len:250 (-) Transcript_8349:330-1079(-)